MSEKIVFTMQNGYVETEISRNINGLESSENKIISLEDFGNLIQKFQSNDTDWLPGQFGLQRMEETKSQKMFAYITPPERKTVQYDDYKYEIVTPILIWFVSVSKEGYHRYSEVFALKSPLFTYKEELFKAPFSNVYPRGNICWGDNDLEFPTNKSIQSISGRFFGAPFNGDLDEDRFRSGNGYNGHNMFRTNHLMKHQDHLLLKDGKTTDEVLEDLNNRLHSQSVNLTDAWEQFKERCR